MTMALSKFQKPKTSHPEFKNAEKAILNLPVEQTKEDKKYRVSLEFSELRKQQIKLYTLKENITIKELFNKLLDQVFGPEKSNFLELSEEEKLAFKEADEFFENNPALTKIRSKEELQNIFEKMKNGEDLVELLGYQNVKD